MDSLQKLANGLGVWRGLLAFLVFSVTVVTVGWLLGVFDYNPADDGGVRLIYQPPTGERRY